MRVTEKRHKMVHTSNSEVEPKRLSATLMKTISKLFVQLCNFSLSRSPSNGLRNVWNGPILFIHHRSRWSCIVFFNYPKIGVQTVVFGRFSAFDGLIHSGASEDFLKEENQIDNRREFIYIVRNMTTTVVVSARNRTACESRVDLMTTTVGNPNYLVHRGVPSRELFNRCHYSYA